ncbi:pyridoxamine 5'-phosphate oxidase [Lacihabitans sp. LS3-19]|uniref:pyridoxamine 5'-phosphate oxidase n=1 Tax=Lacihabitans sp. LS3-19 TaxID=2487335 RepID=UPI0020CE2D5B|nr:pyridoxamine 5'-phosphate oxidase [Lacihabitans sp. LS3-19]MCP9766828.1 pyridoxamine 5'-phosphate oxidase [Lacihabitans sp. LS3-19]
MDKSKIANLRNNYMLNELLENNVSQNPINQFTEWFNDAINAEMKEANAMVLSTVSDGKPKARVVLLKGFDENGFVFFTNYNSHKGAELEGNNFAALTFFWDVLERQVRVEGEISKLSEEDSCEYFWSRPRASQIGAWVSHQSETIVGRETLDEKLEFYNHKFESEDIVPKPPHWGGYVLKPESIEFWQGRPNRLHDRILYSLENENWRIERLSP